MKQPPVNIKNKRATFDYELIDTYTAGIVLTGTEIKSIRLGKASLVDTLSLIHISEPTRQAEISYAVFCLKKKKKKETKITKKKNKKKEKKKK